MALSRTALRNFKLGLVEEFVLNLKKCGDIYIWENWISMVNIVLMLSVACYTYLFLGTKFLFIENVDEKKEL